MKNFYTKDVVSEDFRNSIGDYTYGSPEISGSGSDNLKIGKFCSFAGGVKILLGMSHNYKRFTTYPFNSISEDYKYKVWKTKERDGSPTSSKGPKVIIGNDVWIGCRVTILPGVTIGDGAVIGAGAIVSKDIPPYAVAVGSPIRVIKYRFDKEQIDALLRIKWWNFDMDKLKEAVLDIDIPIDEFVKKYDV